MDTINKKRCWIQKQYDSITAWTEIIQAYVSFVVVAVAKPSKYVRPRIILQKLYIHT